MPCINRNLLIANSDALAHASREKRALAILSRGLRQFLAALSAESGEDSRMIATGQITLRVESFRINVMRTQQPDISVEEAILRRSPHNVARLFNRMLMLVNDDENADVGASTRFQFLLTAITLFNAGLLCHRIGLKEGRRASFGAACEMYRRCLACCETAFSSNATDDAEEAAVSRGFPVIICLAVLNNLRHLSLEGGDLIAARGYLSCLRQMFMGGTASLTSEEFYFFLLETSAAEEYEPAPAA